MNNDTLQGFFNSRMTRSTIVSVFVLLALYLLTLTLTNLSNMGRSGIPATDTITVQGDGTASIAPDVARISFTVQHTASTVSDAQDATTKQANAAIDYVKGQGIAEKDVKTLSYNISPQYAYPNPCVPGALCPDYARAPKVTGYQVSETIQVTVRDLTSVGTLLGGLGGLQVQNVNGPDFTLDDPTAGHDAARADAIANARAQAQMLAKQLGVKLGKIVNYSETTGGYMYAKAYGLGGAMETAAVAPNVPTGENTYSASVSVTYEIR